MDETLTGGGTEDSEVPKYIDGNGKQINQVEKIVDKSGALSPILRVVVYKPEGSDNKCNNEGTSDNKDKGDNNNLSGKDK